MQDGTQPRFAHIAAMHTELLGIGTNGLLYSWRWVDMEPYKHSDVCIQQFVIHHYSEQCVLNQIDLSLEVKT